MIPCSSIRIRWCAVALCGVAVGCAQFLPAKNTGPNGLLTDTAWKLQSLGTHGAIESHQPTLEFGDGDRISGNGSCNAFNGTVAISGKAMSIGPLAATRMACETAIDQQEQTYFAALQQAEWFLVAGSTLTIYTRTLDQPLVFVRTQPQ